MVEWPQERQHRLSSTSRMQPRLEDIPADLIGKLEGIGAFGALVQIVVDAFNEKANPKTMVAELSAGIDKPDAFGDYDEFTRQVVLARLSVAALRRIPTREMWEYLWSLAWHSAALESFLPQAVIAAATETEFRDKFFTVARNVVEEAARNPGRRAIQREKGVGTSRREYWKKHRQLSDLWRGNFEHSSHAVDRDDDHVLSIVAEIDATQFVHLLTLYDYPDPVAHALMWCGVSWRFERWKAAVSAAPAAFGEQATWNGSLILPLLLATAQDQLQIGFGRQPTPEQISDATRDIKSLATEIAKTIASRVDAMGCMVRWGNWLVRSAIPAVSANPVPHPTDAASQGFVDDALFEALIAEMPADSWDPEPAPDAETWESWCQLAAGALVALADKTSMPSPETFLEDWRLSPDEWPTKRGQRLKLHAIPFEGAGLRADGYGGRLLAIPLVEAEHADDQWKRFWESTTTLREIVEFGDSDRANNEGWRSRADPARLLMLQFNIGLMMMDHLIMPPRTLSYDQVPTIANLLLRLDESVREMTAIDQLNRKFWSEAVRHLAIRRANWLSDRALNGVVLSVETKPTLADFVRTLSGDTENLLALAYVTLQNDIDRTVIAAAFKAAKVDLKAEIIIAERLLAISPQKFSFSEAQLDVVRHTLT